MEDKIIKCLKCGKKFVLSKKTQESLRLNGFKHDPVYCLKCINSQNSNNKK